MNAGLSIQRVPALIERRYNKLHHYPRCPFENPHQFADNKSPYTQIIERSKARLVKFETHPQAGMQKGLTRISHHG
jgi:hypothetical protein